MRASRVIVILFLYLKCTMSLIIPEEVPTILSLIYSNIPPIKKGTDSRFGVGFSLGEHADFQIILELGPQTETEPIGNTEEAKRRRDIILNAAMRGEMGPWARTVAEHQLQRKSEKDITMTVDNSKNYENVKRIHKNSKKEESSRVNIIEDRSKLEKDLRNVHPKLNVVNVARKQPSSVVKSDPESYVKKLKTLYNT